MKARFIAITIGVVVSMLTLTIGTFAQPAPPLTDLQIVAARSQLKPGWDPIAINQRLTTLDHSGAWLEVRTKETGYSLNGSRIATFNGSRMREIRSMPILSGRIITGWFREWRIDRNFTSGQVTYRARSITVPNRELSDSVTIR